MWIDTDVWALPDNVIYELYSQPTRGPQEQGSYLAVLPPGYDDQDFTGERYPVLYWLHGGFSCSRHAMWSLQFYARKMELGKMPKVIIIAPQVSIIMNTLFVHSQASTSDNWSLKFAAANTKTVIAQRPLHQQL